MSAAPAAYGIDWSVAQDFGLIYRRRDGRIYLQFGRYGRLYSAHGAPFDTEAKAQAILDAIRVSVGRGTPKRQAVDAWLPTASEAHRVGHWLELWIGRMRELVEAGERSREYLDELERWAKPGGHIAGFWSSRSVHEIGYQGLERWARWLAGERKLGAKTRWNVMAGFRSFLGWLRLVGELQVVPVFPWPRIQEHAPTILAPEAQRRILEAIPEGRRGIYLALALLGLRPSEAIRLRAADYEPGDPGWLTVRLTKNRQAKRLPVPDELAEWIAAHVPADARLRGLPLFAMGRKGWNGTSLRRHWHAACREVGVTVSLYEGTKHSLATELLRQGVSERVLQALLGHRDPRSIRRYARLADQALVEAIRRRKP